MQVTESTIPDQHRLTFSGKRLDDERMISDYNVIHGIHVVRERDSGGADARFLHDVRTVSPSADGACGRTGDHSCPSPEHYSWKRLGNHRDYQERPVERSLAEEVHQHASVWQLQGEGHDGLPLLA